MLLQGETSVGKTSLIHWLAAATGNKCVRINNHEHTDIQEYVGTYSADAAGNLVFKEGKNPFMFHPNSQFIIDNDLGIHLLQGNWELRSFLEESL